MHLSNNLVLKKVIVFYILLTISGAITATDYYVSSAGDDIKNNGLSSSTPWKTIAKVNSVFAGLKAGDRVLFRCGDVFYGTVNISRSGISGFPITIGSYGTGGKPVITGFTTPVLWTNTGSGIYSTPLSCESAPEMLIIDGVQYGMGRYPNNDYLQYESFYTNISVTDDELGSSLNWKGAEAVIRKTNWILDRCLITEHAGTKITYKNLGTSYSGTNNYGYFFQNDIKTLDLFGEWYFNGTTLFVFFGTKSPELLQVRVSTINNLIINNSGQDNIKVENISFSGANKSSVYLSAADYFTVQNCDIDFSGENGIFIQWGSYVTCNNNLINNSNRAGIFCAGGKNATFTNNLIRNSGIIPGAAITATQNNGIYITQNDYCLIQYNEINYSGGNGIYFTGNNVIVKNNFVNNSCQILHDCGGIYTNGNFSDRLIEGNIVLNSFGNGNGTAKPEFVYAEGIYLDAPSQGIIIRNNTAAFCRRSGIFFHESHDNNCYGNTCFNNKQQLRFQFGNKNPNDNIRNILFNDNILFAKTANYICVSAISSLDDIPRFMIAENNYYTRPFDDGDVFYTLSPSTGSKYRNLEDWQLFTGQDLNSVKSPVSVKDTADIDFYYNATKLKRTINLAQPMIDVKGQKYYNSVTLKPYTSIILMVDPEPEVPVPPAYKSSVIQDSEPDRIEISFNVTLGTTSTAPDAFTVKVNGIICKVKDVLISDNKITLILDNPVKFGDNITFSYTQPETNKLQSAKGSFAESIPEQIVKNNIIDPVISNKPPIINLVYEPDFFSGFVYEIDASGTTDPDNDSITYTWKVPVSIPVSGTNGSKIRFLAPVVKIQESAIFTLTADDGIVTVDKTIEINLMPYKPEIGILNVSRVSCSNYYQSYYAENAADANLLTRWSAEGTDQWLMVNLPVPCKISHLQVAFLTEQKYESYFDIYASKDNVIWEPVSLKNTSCNFSGNWQIFNFPDINDSTMYSYIKLVCNGNSIDGWNNISGLKIFGSDHENDSKSYYNSGLIELYPNPVSRLIKVHISEPSSISQALMIYNSSGALCMEEVLDPGVNYFHFAVALTPGIYIAKIVQSGLITHTQKIIVVQG